ncbi:aminopeptidase P family protein, partial [Bacteroidota bacterium]
MFPPQTYIERRTQLKKALKNGIVFLPGNNESPMNYPSNPYKFRQDSNFLYFFGIDNFNLCGIIDIDNDQDIIFGNDREIDDIVWMGPEKKLTDRAIGVGVKITEPLKNLTDRLRNEKQKGRRIHFLPQYRHDLIILFEDWLNISPKNVNKEVSEDLIKAVVDQRSIKSAEEIEQIEQAISISFEMNKLAMKYAKPGIMEKEVCGAIEGLALGMGNGISFPSIFSVRGEILHNHSHENIMKDGDLLVIDSGSESELHYASDITRTFPVNGKYSDKQKGIYNIVLKSQEEAINSIKPNISFKEIHLTAAKEITKGLNNIGIMKGNIYNAMEAGAHALFFPHGLGHMLGLDVHDMEGLGENFVGYNRKLKRSKQFGLSYLRLAKNLKPGYVLTVEPGIYFIPPLINEWK